MLNALPPMVFAGFAIYYTNEGDENRFVLNSIKILYGVMILISFVALTVGLLSIRWFFTEIVYYDQIHK